MSERRNAPFIVSAIFLIIVLGLGGWVGFHLLNPVSIAIIDCKLVQGPPDDTGLKQWLSSQPVIIKTALARGDGTLTIKYKLNNAKAMDYATTVVAQCNQLGYQINGHGVSSNANPFLGTVFFPDPF